MKKDWIFNTFTHTKPLIGMLHVGPLPGAPGWSGDLGAIIDKAVDEAQLYQEAGFHGLILENMHDLPYLQGSQVGPETVAAMSVLALEVRRASRLPLGIQILAGANRQALAVALAAQADFIRAESFVFGHLADEGWMDAQAGPLLRYREQIGAQAIKIVADIKKKHSAHAMSADIGIGETAHAAEFFLADGVIVTGVSTGSEADADQVFEVNQHSQLPVWIGSGITAANLQRYWEADGFVVGSWVKQQGKWNLPLDVQRIQALAARHQELTLQHESSV
jgi:membrane complex biogenesis BtpA family protein